jgi:uncharacterized membrane protein YhaH (DUF805 family)
MSNPGTMRDHFAKVGGAVDGALPSWLSFRGTLSRRSYLVGLLLVAVPALIILSLTLPRVPQMLLALPLVFATASLVVRRLRDVGRPVPAVFLGLLPLVGWVILAWFTSAPSGSTAPTRTPRFFPGLASFLALLLVGSAVMALPDTPAGTGLAETSVQGESSGGLDDEGDGPLNGDASVPETTEDGQGQDTAVSETETPEEQTGEDPVQLAPEPPAEEPVTPQPPAAQTGLEALVAQLVVAEEFPSGYDRDLFRHWVDASGNGCDARREVLIAESTTPVTVGAGCSLTGGTWYSAFDGVTTTDPSTFDIDHFVPLKEAWDSGAHAWDSGTRQRFANDLDFAGSLIAVSASSNRSKGANDPAEWLPPNTAYRCTYLITWVEVKLRWNLSADPREVSAIRSAGASC